MNLYEFREANVARCIDFGHGVDGWEPEMWALAVAGETGELCNLLKKRYRAQRYNIQDDKVSIEDIGDEIADVLTYLDLLAARLGIDLSEALARKFNKVSKRVNSDVKFTDTPGYGLTPWMKQLVEERTEGYAERPGERYDPNSHASRAVDGAEEKTA